MSDLVSFPRERLPKGWPREQGKYHLVQQVRELRMMRLDVLRDLESGRMKINPGLEDTLTRLNAFLDRHRHIR